MSQSLFASSPNHLVTLIFTFIVGAETFLGAAHILTTPAQLEPPEQVAQLHGWLPAKDPAEVCQEVLDFHSSRRSRNRACSHITGSRAETVRTTCSRAACSSRFRVSSAGPSVMGRVSAGSASKSYTSSTVPGSIRITSLKRSSRTPRSLDALRLSARKGFVQP